MYQDADLLSLRYIRALDEDGDAWGEPRILDEWTAGWQSASLLDGRPAVLYGDEATAKLKLLVANDTEGISWSFPVLLDITATTSGQLYDSRHDLLTVDGLLAFGFIDTSGTLGDQATQTTALDYVVFY